MERIKRAILILWRHPGELTFSDVATIAKADEHLTHGNLSAATELIRPLDRILKDPQEQSKFQRLLEQPRQQELPQ